MRFQASFLEEIQARVPVSQVVRRRVKLNKSGREFVGLSPFNQERTPSFFVNDRKMAWFDFSSGKNGNIFDFLMQTEGLSFPEAVERLAGEAGLALPARSPESERQESRRAGLIEVLEWAAAFFEQELAGGRGETARLYLDHRGVSVASRRRFRIGYAPRERHALRDHLAGRGASVETMNEAGLLIHGEDIVVPYDRFRHRVMFPIEDRGGRVIAFGGRALNPEAKAKYLNSPETPLFIKGRGIFNHHRARQAAAEKERVVAVEGYMDVVAMDAAGFPETVATLGTALTEDQLGHLWAMAPQPILCFDGDRAGQKAAARAAELAMPLLAPNRTLSFALLAGNHDPDELIKIEGPQAVEHALGRALPLVDLLWSRALADKPLQTPEQRAGLEGELRALASSIRDPAVKRHYLREFEQRFAGLFGPANDQAARPAGRQRPSVARGFDTGSRRRAPQEAQSGYLSAPLSPSPNLVQRLRGDPRHVPPRESLIMLLLIAHPDLIAQFAEELAALDFGATTQGRALMAARDTMLDWANSDTPSVDLRRKLAAAGFQPLLETIARSVDASSWVLRPETALPDAANVLRQALTLHHRARALHNELISAEAALAADASDLNLARIRDLRDQISAVTGSEAAIEGFGALSGRVSATI